MCQCDNVILGPCNKVRRPSHDGRVSRLVHNASKGPLLYVVQFPIKKWDTDGTL